MVLTDLSDDSSSCSDSFSSSLSSNTDSETSSSLAQWVQISDILVRQGFTSCGARPLASIEPQPSVPEATPSQMAPRNRPPCKFLAYFDGQPGNYAEFCRMYNVPADVDIRRGADSLSDVVYSPGTLVLPLMAIVEGGVRFPLDPFIVEFLRAVDLTTTQISVNTYRIVSSIAELRRQYGLQFGLEELFVTYKLSRTGKPPRWYLSTRPGYDFLIEELPDAERWKDHFVVVRGNIYGPTQDTPIRWDLGEPGPFVCLSLFHNLVYFMHVSCD